VARWWGLEVNLLSTRWAGHTLLAGIDLQRDYRLYQYSYDPQPFYSYLNDDRQGRRAGLYLQDEMALSEQLRLNLGLRYDHSSTVRGGLSPRAALIWQAGPATTFKLIHGTAFRAPNSYELFYEFEGDGGQQSNPSLRKERIRSSEAALSHMVGPSARITATLFNNKVNGLIAQQMDMHGTDSMEGAILRFENLHHMSARGAELEYEQAWSNGATLRTSYSWNRIVGDAEQLVNAPRHLVKLNAAAPLPFPGLRGAFEAQYVAARSSLHGHADAFWLANANLISTRLHDVELALSIYNLFDRRYADPGSTEHVQHAIPQDGRRLRLRVAYAF
jgi:iron complex outermembrane receptor protein